MLTAIPNRVLHALHDMATALLVLTAMGLELLCDEHDHDGALRELEGAGALAYDQGGYVGPGGPGLALLHPGEQYFTRDQVEGLGR